MIGNPIQRVFARSRAARYLLIAALFPIVWTVDRLRGVSPAASWAVASHWARTGRNLHVPTIRTADKPATIGRHHTQPCTDTEE